MGRVDQERTDGGAELRTFLIADIRGYTTYTREQGDEAAGALAARFAESVREVADANEGFLLELRGDEALVVFVSARNALRAGVAMQARFRENDLPRGVGIGLDAGEAVAVEGGYRGGALNLAARLCAQAKAGEVLASEAVIHLAAKVDGLAYVDARTLKLKGYDRPVRAVDVVSSDSVPGGFSHRMHRASDRVRADRRIQAGIAVVLCLAVAAVVLPPVLRDDASSNTVEPGLAFLDAATGDQVSHVELPFGGTSFFAEGLFWVRDSDNSVFLAIDPATHEVVERIPVPFPGNATVDGSRLWVAAQQEPRVVAIDIPSERIIVDRDLAQYPDDTVGMSGILAAEDSIWVQHAEALFRLDPRTGEEQARVDEVFWAGGLAQADDGTIWATSWPGLVQIDPATNERTDLVFDRETDDLRLRRVRRGRAVDGRRDQGRALQDRPRDDGRARHVRHRRGVPVPLGRRGSGLGREPGRGHGDAVRRGHRGRRDLPHGPPRHLGGGRGRGGDGHGLAPPDHRGRDRMPWRGRWPAC